MNQEQIDYITECLENELMEGEAEVSNLETHIQLIEGGSLSHYTPKVKNEIKSELIIRKAQYEYEKELVESIIDKMNQWQQK